MAARAEPAESLGRYPSHVASPDPLLPPDPDLQASISRSDLHVPDLELIRARAGASGVHIKRPFVLGTRDARTQRDSEIFDVEPYAI